MIAPSVIAQDANKSIRDNVLENENLKSFSGLISANEGVAKVFDGKEPMTLLAPSDSAIESFGSSNFPQDAKEIEKILRYHVVNKAAKVDELVEHKYPNTFLTEGVKLPDKAGQVVVVTPKGNGNATISDGINEANIVEGDLLAQNGVIHVIDTVLMPPRSPSETARSIEELSTFSDTLISKEQLSTVDDAKEITIFAPDNNAFSQLSKSTLESDGMKDILKYHVVKGVFYSRVVTNGTKSKTSEGKDVLITVDGDNVSVNDAKVIRADILTNNGVMHIIDTVLDPNVKSSASSIETFSGVGLSAIAIACVFVFF
jgi:uncharacterized surface protein with fasciclin (FAS1) repeats